MTTAIDRHGAALRVGDRVFVELPYLVEGDRFVGRIERFMKTLRGWAVNYRELRSEHLRTALVEWVEYDWTQLDAPGKPRVEDEKYRK
jgi:hypothetical protein